MGKGFQTCKTKTLSGTPLCSHVNILSWNHTLKKCIICKPNLGYIKLGMQTNYIQCVLYHKFLKSQYQPRFLGTTWLHHVLQGTGHSLQIRNFHLICVQDHTIDTLFKDHIGRNMVSYKYIRYQTNGLKYFINLL